MPNINDAFPGRYINAATLGGQAVKAQIARVTFEEVGQARELKAVVHFVGRTEVLTLNKTNALSLARLAGSNLTEHWHGLDVVLFLEPTTYQGRPVQGVRIRGAVQPTLVSA